MEGRLELLTKLTVVLASGDNAGSYKGQSDELKPPYAQGKLDWE